MDRTGQNLLGKYELTRMLGKGGMGEVWEGEHTLTGRRVAVKILADNYLSNKKVVARFGREARAASSVNHPGIVEILDQDKTPDGIPFLVMEFLEGESVGERIRKQGKLSQDEALAIMLPLLDALDSAHQAGIIHRDLKPDNVLILPGQRGDERVKILDFGISQKADEIEHHLTQEGSVLGTPHYMSPEQARGEVGIDARADVYAAGVMFYECVVGDVPFDAGNYNALLQIILGTQPPSPRSRGADVSPAIEQVLLAAMDKDRKRRPPSARAFHDLLLEASVTEDDALLDVETWTFATPSEPPPPVEFGDDGFDDAPPPQAPPKRAPARAPAATLGDFFSEAPKTGAHKMPNLGAPPAKPQKRAPAAGPGFDADPFGAGPSRSPATGGDAAEARNRQVHLSFSPEPDGSFGAFGPGSGEDVFSGPPPAANPFQAPAPRVKPAAGPFDAPPGPTTRGPFDGPGGPAPALAAAPTAPGATAAGGPRAPFEAAPRLNNSVRPGRRGGGNTQAMQAFVPPSVSSDAPDPGGIVKTVLSWLFALAALAALGYLMQVVFKRPPKKRQQTTEQRSGQSGFESSR